MSNRSHMWNETQPMHDWDYMTDFCMRCGMPLCQFVEQNGPLICPDNDAVTYLKVRQQMDALMRPVLEALGLVGPETKH
jgi:hypothetical protein